MELAIERVKTRVAEGGHNIPEDVFRRRYVAGIRNLFTIYLPIVDECVIFDNSDGIPNPMFKKNINGVEEILESEKFNQFKMI